MLPVPLSRLGRGYPPNSLLHSPLPRRLQRLALDAFGTWKRTLQVAPKPNLWIRALVSVLSRRRSIELANATRP